MQKIWIIRVRVQRSGSSRVLRKWWRWLMKAKLIDTLPWLVCDSCSLLLLYCRFCCMLKCDNQGVNEGTGGGAEPPSTVTVLACHFRFLSADTTKLTTKCHTPYTPPRLTSFPSVDADLLVIPLSSACFLAAWNLIKIEYISWLSRRMMQLASCFVYSLAIYRMLWCALMHVNISSVCPMLPVCCMPSTCYSIMVTQYFTVSLV